MKSGSQKAVIWGGWGVSLIFIVWAFMKMDLGKVWVSMQVADYRWIIPAALLNLSILYFRGARWRHFIWPVKKVTRMSAFSALCIGFMANMVLPARIGEFVRAYVLAKRESISKTSAFGTVVIERAFDGLSVVVLMLLVFTLIEPSEANAEFWNSLRVAGMSASAFFIAFFVALYLFHKRFKPIVWLIDTLTGMIPGGKGEKVRELLESLHQGFESIDHGHRLMKVMIWSAVIWGAGGPYNWFIFMAFGMDLPFSACYLVLVSQIFGVMIPSAPGFIGVFHAATIAGLMFYGVEGELALSVALTTHIVMFVMQIIPGLIFLWMEQYSFSEITHAAD